MGSYFLFSVTGICENCWRRTVFQKTNIEHIKTVPDIDNGIIKVFAFVKELSMVIINLKFVVFEGDNESNYGLKSCCEDLFLVGT